MLSLVYKPSSTALDTSPEPACFLPLKLPKLFLQSWSSWSQAGSNPWPSSHAQAQKCRGSRGHPLPTIPDGSVARVRATCREAPTPFQINRCDASFTLHNTCSESKTLRHTILCDSNSIVIFRAGHGDQ